MTVKFTDNKKQVKDTMVRLEKKALQESAKILRKLIKKNVPVHNGVLKKNVGTWVRRRGQNVWLQAGVYNKKRADKRGYTYAFHAHLVHFGTVKTKGVPYLSRTVREAIPMMVAKQSEYLPYLEDEAKALARMANNDEEIADDGGV